MAIVLPTPRPFAGIGQGAMNFVQGLQRRDQQARQAQDVQAFTDFVQRQQFEQQPGFAGPPSPVPNFQTSLGSNLMGNYVTKQALMRQGVTGPTNESELYARLVQKDPATLTPPERDFLERKNRRPTTKVPSIIQDPNDPSRQIRVVSSFNDQGDMVNQTVIGSHGGADGFTLGAGQTRFGPKGEPIAEVPTEPEKPKMTTAQSVIVDPNDPNKAIRVMNTFRDGELVRQVPIGEATLADKIGGVAAEGLPIQKATQTKIEKDLIDINSTLSEIDVIEDQFNEDFFTFRGKGTAFFSGLAEKLEIPIPKAQSDFLEEKTKFFADSKRVFLKFRKFITGVAGGIQEFNEIAKAAINPEKDSPTEFKAKITSMRDNAKRTRNVMLAMSNSGLDPNSESDRQRVFSGLSLSNVPLDMPENATLESFQPKTMTATNPTTGEKIQSLDGGETWQPMQ